MSILLTILFCFALTGCEICDGLRQANNPNNWDHQWDHDPCNPNYKPSPQIQQPNE